MSICLRGLLGPLDSAGLGTRRLEFALVPGRCSFVCVAGLSLNGMNTGPYITVQILIYIYIYMHIYIYILVQILRRVPL